VGELHDKERRGARGPRRSTAPTRAERVFVSAFEGLGLHEEQANGSLDDSSTRLDALGASEAMVKRPWEGMGGCRPAWFNTQAEEAGGSHHPLPRRRAVRQGKEAKKRGDQSAPRGVAHGSEPSPAGR